MRLPVFIFIILMAGVHANGYAQRALISLNLPRTSLTEALGEIEQQSAYYFYYNLNLDDYKAGPVSVKNKDLKEVLELILKESGLKFEVIDHYIVIKKADNSGIRASAMGATPQRILTGRVSDLKGIPLPGVSVAIKGRMIGTITDAEGFYTLTNVPDSTRLLFSFVGMKPLEVAVGKRTNVDVSMEESMVYLDEVVAIGYGLQKKILVNGSAIHLTGKELQRMNTVSPLTAMQSQSPGLSITKYSGKPGSDFKINIRGLGTIGNASPLVIVDDVVGGDLNVLNPADIESIDILKDAASAAIYGARAANGVILVRTRKGKNGPTRTSYDGYYGLQKVARYVDMLDAPQYLEMQNESFRNSGAPIPDWASLVPTYEKIRQGWKGTNWQKEFTNQNTPVQNHSFNLSGGSDGSSHSMGISYTSQEGIYGQPAAPLYERYSMRLNSEHVVYKNSLFDVIKVGENLLYNLIDQKHNGLATENISWNDIHEVTSMYPLMPVYDANNQFSKVTLWSDNPNPIGRYNYVRANHDTKSHNLRINAFVEVQPIRDLIFKSSFGYLYSSVSQRMYVPVYNLGGPTFESQDRVDQLFSSGIGYQFQNTLSYQLKGPVDHHFEVLLGQSVEKNGMGESMNGSNRGSIFNSFEYAYLSNVKTMNPSNISLGGAPWDKNVLSSYFGRINYNYRETVMATVIVRADGSSNFEKGHRWGHFPSLAAGWILSNQSFMEPTTKVINFLKLRASWGQNGNQAVAPFQYLSTFSFSGADYYFGPEKNSADIGIYPSILPNKDLTWETSEQLNLGLDLRFLRSRLGINIDWYQKITKDWLVQAPVPATWGATAPYINGGDIQNKGTEIVFSWNDQIGELTYGFNANVSFNKNKVIKIANPEGIIEGGGTTFSTADRENFYRAQVGFPIGYFYGYQTAGVFQNEADIAAWQGAKLAGTKPGDLIFVDSDHSGIIDTKDKTFIGDPNPDVLFGWTFNLGYKNFDFSISADGVAGNQIASSLRQADELYGNWPAIYLDRWHGEGTSNRYPRFDAAVHPNWGWNSDIYVDNGDFLRLQNITLGYDFKNKLSHIPFTQARLYMAVNNLYTFTKYYGADPEVGYAQVGWSKGIDIGFYPSSRTFLLGVNLEF